MDVDRPQTPVEPPLSRREQAPLMPLNLDISGEAQPPTPVPVEGDRCACCGLWTHTLWQGARSGLNTPHAVCTLCYLAGHLDSPTATHGLLAFLPGMAMTDVHHLQRRALLAILAGTRSHRREGKRVWRWLARHGREVEQAWGTMRAGEFASAFKRLAPHKRLTLQTRLAGCALILPQDVFDDLSLLLPAGKTIQTALIPQSWGTYTRSNLYVEPDPLD